MMTNKGFYRRALWFFLFCILLAVPYFSQGLLAESNRQIVDSLLEEFSEQRDLSTGELMVLMGSALLETPYEAHTLEGDEEELIIKLEGVDCTTFVENCLALARTLKGNDPAYDSFVREVELIRYRDGKLDGYASRLHYFSDWIHNNQKKCVLKDLSRDFGGEELGKNISFMSSHPGEYRQLQDDPELVEEIKGQEAIISKRSVYYLPAGIVEEGQEQFRQGDIAAISTSIEGLDVMHTGILVSREGKFHLMHASSSSGKVLISELSLMDYLEENKSATGIMLARPL